MEKVVQSKEYRRPANMVFDYVVSKIRNGDLQAGQRIKERQIAKELNISHIPVREAMEKLQNLAWVNRIPYRGVVVREFDESEIKKLTQVREILETGAMSDIANQITSEHLEHLKELVDIFETAAKSKDAALYQDTDAKFHKYLVDMANNEILSNLYESIVVQSKGFFLATAVKLSMMWNEEEEELAYFSHKQIYKALATGNYYKAIELLRDHVREGCRVAIVIHKTKEEMRKKGN